MKLYNHQYLVIENNSFGVSKPYCLAFIWQLAKKFKRKIKPTHFFKMCYLVADVQHYQEYAIIGVSLTKCYSLETC